MVYFNWIISSKFLYFKGILLSQVNFNIPGKFHYLNSFIRVNFISPINFINPSEFRYFTLYWLYLWHLYTFILYWIWSFRVNLVPLREWLSWSRQVRFDMESELPPKSFLLPPAPEPQRKPKQPHASFYYAEEPAWTKQRTRSPRCRGHAARSILTHRTKRAKRRAPCTSWPPPTARIWAGPGFPPALGPIWSCGAS